MFNSFATFFYLIFYHLKVFSLAFPYLFNIENLTILATLFHVFTFTKKTEHQQCRAHLACLKNDMKMYVHMYDYL